MHNKNAYKDERRNLYNEHIPVMYTSCKVPSTNRPTKKNLCNYCEVFSTLFTFSTSCNKPIDNNYIMTKNNRVSYAKKTNSCSCKRTVNNCHLSFVLLCCAFYDVKGKKKNCSFFAFHLNEHRKKI